MVTPKPTLGPECAELPVFAEKILGLKVYPWQRRAMCDISRKFSRTAVRAANGSGKTRMLAAPAAFWNAVVNPGSTTVVSSGVMRQVREQFWPAFRDLCKPFQASLNITINASDATIALNDSRIIGFTAREGNLFEGFHTTGANKSLMIILDEAKSIDVDIFRAVERCQPDRLLMVSSPGLRDGCFYRAWSHEENLWGLHVVTAYDCPHIRQEWIDMQIKRWPEGDPLIKSMIYAEWMDDDGVNLVIPHSVYERAVNDPPDLEGSDKFAGVDFAAGGDENVIVVRQGNTIVEVIAWKEKDTMASARTIIAELRKHGVPGENTFADAGGLGAPMCDRLAELGFPVCRVNFGGRANESDLYANRGTEMWFRSKRMLEKGEIAVPADQTLGKQLVTRRYKRAENTGKLILESKDAVRRRGSESPDRADAFVLCCAGETWIPDEDGFVHASPTYDEVLEGDFMEDLPVQGLHL